MTSDPQSKMERYYLDTRVWRGSVMGLVIRCDHAFKLLCVEWTGSREPEWVSVANVKRLREIMTQAIRRQLAARPK